MTYLDVCYGLIHDTKTDEVLIVQNEHGGWSFPGGSKEPNETLLDTVHREILEETSLEVNIVDKIETREQITSSHLTFHIYSVKLKDESRYGSFIISQDQDIQMTKWIQFDEIADYLPWYADGFSHLKQRAC